MKKALIRVFIIVFFIHAPFLINILHCQPLPPSNPGGGGESPIGGTADIGDGILPFMILVAIYASYKVIRLQFKQKRNHFAT